MLFSPKGDRKGRPYNLAFLMLLPSAYCLLFFVSLSPHLLISSSLFAFPAMLADQLDEAAAA